MNFFTYRITNTQNNKTYIGWTNKNPISKRLNAHVTTAKRGSKLLLHNAMNKHGFDKFNIELVNSFKTKEEVLKDEVVLIAEGKTNHCRYHGGGYNMTDGGEGTAGYRRSEEAIRKTADKNRGRTSKRKGKTYKEIYGERAEYERITRAKSIRGKKRTTTQKNEMSKRSKGNKWGCFPVEVTYKNGTIITYPSREVALKELNIKSATTLRAIATGTYWKKGKHIKYNSPYDFTVKLLRIKI